MIYFTSDTHFGHKNIIKYCSRPYSSVEEMDTELSKNWNRHVRPEDMVIHLGDVSFHKPDVTKRILSKLNGKKHLIIGNHDKEDEHRWMGVWDTVQHYKELKYERTKFVLFHFGLRVWNKSRYDAIHLYGHSHGTLPPHGRSVDVGVDCKEITSEYCPVSIVEVMNYMSTRKNNI